MNLTGYSRLFGLIGYPLSHSFSKRYFSEKFAKEGIEDCYYELFPIKNIEDLPRLIKEYPNLRGLNVTIPYKQAVIPYLDEVESSAKAVGAVNTIKVENGKLKGFNSDIYGFEVSLKNLLASANILPNPTTQEPRATTPPPPPTPHEPRATSHEPPTTNHEPRATSHQPRATNHEPPPTNHLKPKPQPPKPTTQPPQPNPQPPTPKTYNPQPPTQTLSALILGTGGAAKAVAYVLNQLGIEYLKVSRDEKKGNVTYEQIDANFLNEYRLIINTTPLGMSPKINTFPQIPYTSLGKDHLLYDLVYNPELTSFLEKGQANGAVIQNGLEMLYLQAEKSWAIWNE